MKASAAVAAAAVIGRTTGPTRRSTKGGWTDEEDELLRKAVGLYKGKNWKKIAEFFPDRNDVQCLHRWQKVLDPELIKGPWTKEEDDLIIELVTKHGSKKWSVIAQSLKGRIGKQCRERWHNHLDPSIKKEAWTVEEEVTLIRAHQIYGNRWAEIAKVLPGRADNSIKNHWNCSVKKRLDTYLVSRVSNQPHRLPIVDLNKSLSQERFQKADPVTQRIRNPALPDRKPTSDMHFRTHNVDLVRQSETQGRLNLDLQLTTPGSLEIKNQPPSIEVLKCIRGAGESILKKDSSSKVQHQPFNKEITVSPGRLQGNASDRSNLGIRDINWKFKETTISSLSACDATATDRVDDQVAATPVNCARGNSDPLCNNVPLQSKDKNGSVSSKVPSKAEGYVQKVQHQPFNKEITVSPGRLQGNASDRSNLGIGDINWKFKETTLSSLSACDATDTDRVDDQVAATPVNCAGGNSDPLCNNVPLQSKDKNGSVSSKVPSKAEGYVQKVHSPVHCFAPSDCILPSQMTILRSLAKSFETPSIIRKRACQISEPVSGDSSHKENASVRDSAGVSDFLVRCKRARNSLESEHGSNGQLDLNTTNHLDYDQFFRSSIEYFENDTSGTTKSVARRLEDEFDMERDGSSLRDR